MAFRRKALMLPARRRRCRCRGCFADIACRQRCRCRFLDDDRHGHSHFSLICILLLICILMIHILPGYTIATGFSCPPARYIVSHMLMSSARLICYLLRCFAMLVLLSDIHIDITYTILLIYLPYIYAEHIITVFEDFLFHISVGQLAFATKVAFGKAFRWPMGPASISPGYAFRVSRPVITAIADTDVLRLPLRLLISWLTLNTG